MPVHHYRTIDCGIKLASFAGVPTAHDVASMDKLLTAELDRLVTHERQPPVDEPVEIGHILSTIFQSFDRSLVPQASTLQVPFSKIRYRDELVDRLYSDTSPDTLIPLYDVNQRRWTFPLPKSNAVEPTIRLDSELDTDAEKKTAEYIFASFLNTLRSALLHHQPKFRNSPRCLSTWHATYSEAPIDDDIPRKPDLVLSDGPSPPDWGGITVCAELTTTLYKPGNRIGKELDTRAFLMAKKQPWRRFMSLLSFSNTHEDLRVHIYDRSGSIVSPFFDIHRDPDTFLYILSCLNFGEPTCVGFDHTIALLPSHTMLGEKSHEHVAHVTPQVCQQQNEPSQAVPSDPRHPSSLPPSQATPPDSGNPSSSPSHVSLSDSGYASTPPCDSPDAVDSPVAVDELPQKVDDNNIPSNHPEPIGTIRVKNTIFEIIKILFSSQGLVGRATICYLVRLNGEYFVIKDHWVLGDEGSVQNEMEMLVRVKGISGVPELVDFCIVQTETGVPDRTSSYRFSKLPSTRDSYRTHVRLVFKPCARSLQMFDTKRELVQVLRDVVAVQQEAVLERDVLHRDSSLNNVMIEDREGHGRGMLIDWEFAVARRADNTYDIGGTGTIPFMSRRLLAQVVRSIPHIRPEPHKTASNSIPGEPRRVIQTHRDDLESLFYVFIWICIKYKGPCGMERQLDPRSGYLPLQWATNPADAVKAKVYLFGSPVLEDGASRIDTEFHPYFSDLLPLAHEWYTFVLKRLSFPVESPFTSSDVEEDFRSMLAILDKALDTLAPELPGKYTVNKIILEEAAKELQEKAHGVQNDLKKRRYAQVASGLAYTMEPSKRANLRTT